MKFKIITIRIMEVRLPQASILYPLSQFWLNQRESLPLSELKRIASTRGIDFETKRDILNILNRANAAKASSIRFYLY